MTARSPFEQFGRDVIQIEAEERSPRSLNAWTRNSRAPAN